MKARLQLWFALWLNVLVWAGAALGDGCVFLPWDPRGVPEVRQPTQKVYIRWDGAQEKLLIQTRYEGPAEEMVWMVPVPSQPTVERGDAAIFDELREQTAEPDLSYTDFAGLQMHGATGGVAGLGGSTVAEWHRRVGDYDVVLLRPVAGEDAIQWLNSNEFAVPDEIAPVLEDYIREGWWMVASRIHPEALTDITRDKLADGTLHPLEFAFEASACVFPMRLTRMVAGPVEELIYIDGPGHYEPVTFADDRWKIGLHGGPLRQVRNSLYLSDVEYVTEIVEGRSIITHERCITRLRRVFQPEEMVEDLYFGELDYAKWLASDDALRVAQAATQYGRHRDPNGMEHLLGALSPETLDEVNPTAEDYHESLPLSARILSLRGVGEWSFHYSVLSSRGGYEQYLQLGCTHVRSCIWALGEIALEHEVANTVEEALVRCAEHDNQLVRMEAYLALMKLRSERLGAILVGRIADVLGCCAEPPMIRTYDLQVVYAEMEIVAEWIQRFGTVQEKASLVDALLWQIEHISPGTGGFWSNPEREWSTPYSWIEWIVWRAACSQDARLLAPLEEMHARLIDDTHPVLPSMTRAEAACGSAVAAAALAEQTAGEEAAVLERGQAEETGGIASLDSFFVWRAPSLRVQITAKRFPRYQLFPMPEAAADAVLRMALSEKSLDDWYALYLLARIRKPLAQDQERLLTIWNGGDETKTLVAADVLFAWGDERILLDGYGKTDLAEVRAEIAWALAQLQAAKAAPLIEEQVYESWNELWLTLKQPFLLRPSSRSGPVSPTDPEVIDAMRKAEALWYYFHPTIGTLDDDRLALLKRLAADATIDSGMRVELLASDYGTTDWGKPLLEAAAMEVLEAAPAPETVTRLVKYTNNAFVVNLCCQAASDEFLRTLLNSLLTGAYGSNQGVVQGLLWEVWPPRYRETEGESLLFRTPGDPDFDGYCQRDTYGTNFADTLTAIVADDGLPAGYRAFVIIHWDRAPQRVSAEQVEALLQEDMPDFLRKGLEQRLAEWE